jgi:2,4-diketo-3-deoxy-L-fuconate hydrolase
VRIANVDGRLKLLVAGGAVDVEQASRERFSSAPETAFACMGDLAAWARGIHQPTEDWDPALASSPSPRPRQVFAVGLNYLDHAAESHFEAPSEPVVFTKFPSSLAGAVCEVELPSPTVDWEVEVVAVVGSVARHVAPADGWRHLAGLSVGQDLSERTLQRRGPAPQFGLAKSFARFSPVGPALVTCDELDQPDDLALGCELNGEAMQKARTSEMIFSIPELVAYLSSIVTLFPGDLIFTGTPQGVGMGRNPPRFLQPGDRLRSWVEGLGEIRQTFVPAVPRGEKTA